jgi:cytochrome c-type biogenesis protein CcmF
VVAQLQPEKRHYFSSAMPITEAAIDSSWSRDLYVALGEVVEPHAQTHAAQWNLHFYDKPFISWLWAGGLLMVLGGLVAALDKRYRRKASQKESH